jgi:hypothetical protein
MPGLDIATLLESMGTAAAGVLQSKWPAVRSFATTEFQKIAQTITSIGAQVASGEITTDEAAILLDMQQNASRAVIASLEGMTLIAAEQAVNAALAAIKGVVNSALGFALIA